MTVSTAEVERRYSRIRSLMGERGYDALIVVSCGQQNFKGPLRYVSNFPIIVRLGYCVIPRQGDPTLIIPTYKMWAQRYSWIVDIRVSGDMAKELVNVLSSVDYRSKKVGVVGLNDAMSLADYRSVADKFPEIELEEARGLLDEIRSVKSEEELASIKKTAQTADSGFELLLQLTSAGGSEREILGEIEKYFVSQGVEDRLVLICSGPSDGLFQLFLPTRRAFEKGDAITVSIEIAGEGGYWFQLIRTLSVGEAKSDLREQYEVRMEAENQFLELMRPGQTVGPIIRTVQDTIGKAGCSTSASSGHGTGLDFAEAPNLVPDSSFQLRENTVITLHPHILTGGRGGNFLANTYVLTPAGLENLSRWDSELKVV
jgi:Xaa-Pro aminopeptidase